MEGLVPQEARRSCDMNAFTERYRSVRAWTEGLCASLSAEDCTVQSMDDASPAKWHLAHTTWFFETFLLERQLPGYSLYHPSFRVLFNSYYNAVGEQYPRPRRGLLTRPTLDEVRAYRRHVDQGVLSLLQEHRLAAPSVASVLDLGLQHEQQHQELILMDIKHLLSCNPLQPAYLERPPPPLIAAADLRWHRFSGGIGWLGHSGGGFAFDNESPRHRVFIQPYELASRAVTNGEFLEFIEEGGYGRPELWLSDGWGTVQRLGWRAPLYWRQAQGGWTEMTLAGSRDLELAAPVCHVSYYEADAFARWKSARLPTEMEWEHAAAAAAIDAGNFIESGLLHPAPLPPDASNCVAQLFGDVWEWTASTYLPYPGYRPPQGALGEYNGKFMCNQMVLRGGSCVTPRSHIRASYRNFFYPEQRWQFGGIRLARDA